MPYCFNCGKPVNETDKFCASCGAELYLRKSVPHDSERRFPTPPFTSPEQTQHPSRTRLLTPDSEDTEQTRDYGKTRLIDPDREESGPTPVSGKTRLMGVEDITRLKARDKQPFAEPLPQQIAVTQPIIPLQSQTSDFKDWSKKQSRAWYGGCWLLYVLAPL